MVQVRLTDILRSPFEFAAAKLPTGLIESSTESNADLLSPGDLSISWRALS